jgi:tyrosine-protein phosphatase OCA1
MVGCLRRLQNWNLTSILTEYHLFAEHKRRYATEQFIELFDPDLICVPSDPPAWWLAQQPPED